MKTTEPIRDKQQIALLVMYYFNRGQMRNCLLITLCLHTALRISDVLRLSTDDVYDFKMRRIKNSINITEKKTGKQKTIALHKDIKRVLAVCFPSVLRGAPLIRNKRTNKAISRIQAYRLIRSAAESTGFTEKVSCHSLRKTFGYHAWKDGVSPAVIMEIYNHSSLAVTRRYLGVTQDDKNAVYTGLKLVI